MGGGDDLFQQVGIADQGGDLGADGRQACATSLGVNTRGSAVCTTRTPSSEPPSISGTPRKEW